MKYNFSMKYKNGEKMKNKIINGISILLTCFVVIAFTSDVKVEAANTSGSSSGVGYAKVGLSGGQFLKIAHGARGNGMAGAVSAITNDLSSIFWNPAGIAEIPSLTAEFDYTSWLGNFNHNFAAAGIPLGESFALAVHFTGLTSGEMERTTMEKPEGTNTFFTANDVSIGLTFAGFLTDQFSFGITARLLDNSMAYLNATGISFDVGTKYNTGVQGIILGVSLHGLSTELSYTGNELNRTHVPYDMAWGTPLDVMLGTNPFTIPLLFRANVAADIYRDREHTVVGAVDFVTVSDAPEEFAIGSEYTWKDLIAIRAGYRFGHSLQGFSAGAGVKYYTGGFSGKVDYSFSPMYNDMGLVHRVSILIDLGK